MPDVDFLPDTIALDRGHVVVNDDFQTTDSKVFAIGDIVRPGLLTHAIGHGRRAAEVIDDIFNNRRPQSDIREMIDYTRMTLEYFDPRVIEFSDMNHCGANARRAVPAVIVISAIRCAHSLLSAGRNCRTAGLSEWWILISVSHAGSVQIPVPVVFGT